MSEKSKKLSPLEVYNLLPKTNCKECGYPSCIAFATNLLLGKNKLEDCPPLFRDPKYAANLEKLKTLLKPMEEMAETGIKLDPDKCTGCGNCVVVCPVNVSIEPKIAKGIGVKRFDLIFLVENGKAKILDLEKCRRFPPERINCRVCEEYCYSGAIEIF